ncbi:MAG: hypothetical protein ABSC32_08145 [Steroidobacteraceae bacterium]
MKLTVVGLMLIMGLLEASAGWSEPEPASRERFVCTFRADQRFIDIFRLNSRGPRGGACRVDYTKGGVTKQVWSSNGDYAYCVKQAVGLVTELSKGSFSCKPRTTEPPESEPTSP